MVAFAYCPTCRADVRVQEDASETDLAKRLQSDCGHPFQGLVVMSPCPICDGDNMENLDANVDSGPRLIIVCGLPGAGKTSEAKRLESRLNALRLSAVRFCPDEWMEALSLDLFDEDKRSKIEKLQWQFGQTLLALGGIVIIEWGTWGRSERDTLRLGARALGAAVELHYLSAPVDVLMERIQRRGMENPPIEMGDLLRWSAIFQAPTSEEIALYDTFFHVIPPGKENASPLTNAQA